MSVVEACAPASLHVTVVRPATVEDGHALRAIGCGEFFAQRLLVVVRSGVVLGGVGISSTDDPAAAEVTGLYVHPEHREGGLARMLLRGACANIVAQGRSHAVAWIDPGDGRAGRVLTAAGWSLAPGVPGRGLRYRRRVLTPVSRRP